MLLIVILRSFWSRVLKFIILFLVSILVMLPAIVERVAVIFGSGTTIILTAEIISSASKLVPMTIVLSLTARSLNLIVFVPLRSAVFSSVFI